MGKIFLCQQLYVDELLSGIYGGLRSILVSSSKSSILFCCSLPCTQSEGAMQDVLNCKKARSSEKFVKKADSAYLLLRGRNIQRYDPYMMLIYYAHRTRLTPL